MSAHAEMLGSCSVTQGSCCNAEPPDWFMRHQWLSVNHSGQTLKSAQRVTHRHTLTPAKKGFKSSSIPTKLSPERDPAVQNTKKMQKWHAQMKKALKGHCTITSLINWWQLFKVHTEENKGLELILRYCRSLSAAFTAVLYLYLEGWWDVLSLLSSSHRQRKPRTVKRL